MTEPLSSPYTPLSASLNSVVPHQEDCNILFENEIIKIKKDIADGDLLKVVSDMNRPLKVVSQAPVNIAVTGVSGNGMSTFINALRNIGHEEEASAPTGIVQTTQTRAAYVSSLFPNVLLWDLPGMGSITETLQDYPVEMQFHQYDLFIIIASQQFSVNHVKLVKTIKDLGKKSYIVWTKLDQDLSSSILPDLELQQNIRNHILGSLQKARVCEPPIFLVSSLNPCSYEFPQLRDTLEEDICQIRRDGPLQNMIHYCEQIIDNQVTSVQKTVTVPPLQSVFGIWHVDDLAECLKSYRSNFGVDDEALQQVAQRKGNRLTDYTDVMKSHDAQRLRSSDLKLKCMTCVFARITLFLLNIFPPCRFLVTYFRKVKQRYFLKIVAEDLKTVLTKILRDSVMPNNSQRGIRSSAGSFWFGTEDYGV
ncbi:immunity-related GTPase family M protein [Ochotona curzoniae]|uniref:immunity-related GTPase family M protein n=1 Tax=Ochotona curzoniae TaxID=130825 RepID=UPI001B34E4AA|nr:immunity-related GTPase family M protein [Ochotona curzoniae]